MKSLFTLLIGLLFAFQSHSQTILAQAKEGDKWGYINEKGEFVIKPQYDKCNAFGEDGLAAIYEKKRKSFYFIKPDGSELTTELPSFRLSNVIGFGTKGYSEGLVVVKTKKTWGYMDTNGKLVIPEKFSKASPFNNGYAIVEGGTETFVIDTKGNVTKIEIRNLEDVKRFSDGVAAYKANGVWGLIDTNGKIVFKAKYKSLGYMVNGLAWAKNEAGKVGFIDATGEMKIDAKFEAAKDFQDGLAKVKNGSWSYIDANGKMITPTPADSYGKYNDGLAYAKKEGKVGFIDKKGSWSIKPTFDKVRNFSNGVAAAREGEKWGFIDKSGKWVIKPQFDAVKDFHPTSK